MPYYPFDTPSLSYNPEAYDISGAGGKPLPGYLAQPMVDYQSGYPDRTGLPSYLSLAMSDPRPALPPTSISQAMAGLVSAPTPLSAAMNPQAALMPLGVSLQGTSPSSQGPGMTPIQSMFQNQATNPNLSLDNGLISAGSALMGGSNFQQGMAGAGQALSDSFDKTLNNQRALNTPQVTPLADGSFSMVQLPGQAPQVVPNSQVQNFLVGRAMMQNQFAMNKDVYMANLNAQRDQEKNDRLQAQTYGPKVQMTNQAIQTTQAALAEARRQADQEPVWATVQGTFPGVANFLGTDAAQGNNLIQNALVDTQLAQDAQKSGAITDQQAKMLGADVPSISSSRGKVLVPFLERRLEALQRYQAYQQSQVDKGDPTPTQGFVAGDSGHRGGVLSNRRGTTAPIRGNGMSYVQ